ncbi:hypothetical protein EVG20_g9378 [Dentipellis fragilis]|uniref:Uncharacterized protein n=1 Tax=Dentipellis fragilis TaxID=205917 RepID=A0A4Y9Y112_9AGAM|nr:hypothetical protein EVG20_g9378 [Dentipellis fragilis]
MSSMQGANDEPSEDASYQKQYILPTGPAGMFGLSDNSAPATLNTQQNGYWPPGIGWHGGGQSLNANGMAPATKQLSGGDASFMAAFAFEHGTPFDMESSIPQIQGLDTLLSASEVTHVRDLLAVTLPEMGKMLQLARDEAAAARTEAREAIDRAKQVEAMYTAHLVQRESSAGVTRTPKKAIGSRNHDLENIVHKKIISMLGLKYAGRKATAYHLPDPPTDSAELLIPAENEAATWTPIWTKSIADSEYNQAFIERADKLLVDAEANIADDKRVYLAVEEDRRMHAVVTYFNHLCGNYQIQQDPEVLKVVSQKKAADAELKRRNRAAADLHAAAEQVEKDLAEHLQVPLDEVRGVASLVHAEWLDHLHKDYGNATFKDWNERKRKAGGGVQTAWEACRLCWKSLFLRKIYLLLAKKQHESRNTETTDGLVTTRVTFIFPGLHVNAIDDPRSPLARAGGFPWHKCVSDAWISRHQGKMVFKDDDVRVVPVLGIDIPDGMFTKEDQLWLEVDDLDVTA